jgi:hypothetical protein
MGHLASVSVLAEELMKHQCPADGCTQMLPRHLLFCAYHWHRVPFDLRRQVYAAWGNYEKDPRTYLAVRQEAVDAVNATLSRS